MTPTKGVFAWEPAPTLFGVCVCILAVLFLDLVPLSSVVGLAHLNLVSSEPRKGRRENVNAWRTADPTHPVPGCAVQSPRPHPHTLLPVLPSFPQHNQANMRSVRTSLVRVC